VRDAANAVQPFQSLTHVACAPVTSPRRAPFMAIDAREECGAATKADTLKAHEHR
jgi:hypothetical protein